MQNRPLLLKLPARRPAWLSKTFAQFQQGNCSASKRFPLRKCGKAQKSLRHWGEITGIQPERVQPPSFSAESLLTTNAPLKSTMRPLHHLRSETQILEFPDDRPNNGTPVPN